MRFEVAPLPLDVVVCFFLWTGIVPSLWEFVWNVSRNGICLYYYLVYPSLGRLYFTHNSGWHQSSSHFVRTSLDFPEESLHDIVGTNGFPMLLRVSIKGQTRLQIALQALNRRGVDLLILFDKSRHSLISGLSILLIEQGS